jgi:simple sugar transport system permease protein
MIDIIEPLLHSTVAAGTTYLFGTLGTILTEKSGVQNLGVEGIMAMGAVTGFAATSITGNVWIGVASAAVIAGLMAVILSFMCITLGRNQIVSGLALTMLGLGLSGILGKSYVGLRLPSKISESPIPYLDNIPILGSFLFTHDLLTYLSIFLVPLVWFLLFRTSGGIIIRSVGENPDAVDALGISVEKTRYLCAILGGVFIGLAGAYLSLSYTPAWSEGMTGGKGWIIVGLSIFSMWSPDRAIIGAYLFGGIEVLQYRLQPFGISPSLLAALPYLSAIVALLFGASKRMKKRIGAPSALGKPFKRGAE